MKNIQIQKFEFKELSNDSQVNTEEVIESGNDAVQLQEDPNDIYGDHNILNEIGQSNDDYEQKVKNTVKLTQEELDSIIVQAKQDAVNEYVLSQPVVEEKDIINDHSKIITILEDIQQRFEIEIGNLLENMLKLSYAIAAKVIDTQLMSLSQEKFTSLVLKKIHDMHFSESVRIEVRDESLAKSFREAGIEVSVNNDMLAADYKILWCNGFLEKNSANIAAEIEKILIDEIKK